MNVSKLPPQAIELEEAILSSCLLDKDSLNIVSLIITKNTFYKEQHSIIYSTMLSLSRQNSPIDLLTVTQELKKEGNLEKVGGAFYISTLTSKTTSPANIEFYARVLVQQEIKRDIIRLSTQCIQEAYEEGSDSFELVDKLFSSLISITNFKKTDKIKHIGEIHHAAITEMRSVIDSGKTSGIPSGITYLDNLTNGWQKSDLIVLAARPSMGKTSEALQFVKHPSYHLNIPTAFFSLEMSAKQLVGRLQSSESFINVTKITTSNLDSDELNAISRDCVKLSNMPLYIDDTANLSIVEFKQKAKKLVVEHKVELIVVDYLQLMSADAGKNSTREQEISLISRGLKQTAKELNIPIIALAQLSRAVETRGGAKKPQLSDLRDGGSIEQDADMVIFAYRPEYYGFNDVYEYHTYKLEPKQLLLNIISKHRNGALGEIPMKFKAQFMRIENYVLEQPLSKIVEKGEESPF